MVDEQEFHGYPRVNILGVGVHAVNMCTALHTADALLKSSRKGYICVTGVHGIMEAQGDDSFRRIQNASYLTIPDGMPTVWIGRLRGERQMNRVYGPDFMLELCKLSISRSYRHFFYGGVAGVAQHLAEVLARRCPGLQIAGSYTPPFRPLNEEEERELRDRLTQSRADILWVGLSTPKQERFMAEYFSKLPVKLMVGVGAAFDMHTGRTSDSPEWVKQIGMQWFHRLMQEPERLWKRYLYNNPRFVWKACLQMSGIRNYPMATQTEAREELTT
jgi:N-acetylglucosaminyldiphosphoundecaprenol N-acetyl-beta-D-mannosaminyltransferase